MPAITHSFKRSLVKRLAFGGLAVTLLLGGFVLWDDLERVDDAIVALAQGEAQRMAPRLPPDLNALDAGGRAALAAMLDSFIAERAQHAGGHFVIAEIYDRDRKSVADDVTPGAAAIDRSIDAAGHRFDRDQIWYAKHLIEGHLVIHVTVPLRTTAGRLQGWFEGAYLMPWPGLARIAASGLRGSALVIIAIFATTALLYPVIASLSAGVIARSQALLDANLGTLEALGSAIAKRDSDTNSHNYRVALTAVRLAGAIGLPDAAVRALIKGAFLHDVGKLAIPDAILLKPGRLTEAEFAVMKTHVAHGLDIVSRLAWLADARPVIGSHHEKFDGSGYLDGRGGEDIPLIARIFAIADVFDALTSERPYKAAMPLDQAVAIMAEGRGSHFDPALLDVFLALAPRLHAEIAGREDSALADELHALMRTAFAETATG